MCAPSVPCDTMPVVRTLFLHGAGRSGVAAWPHQVAMGCDEWTFLERSEEGDDPQRDARRIVDVVSHDDGGVIVAHSYGANAAVLASQRCPELVRGLVLFEPACFDLARGCAGVEAEISRMAPVFESATDPSVSDLEFSALFAAASGLPVPNLPAGELALQAARLRTLASPWNTGIDPSLGLPVRCVVVTSANSALYEEVAEALVALGAQHLILPGTGHRPQDSADVTELIELVC